MRRALLPGIALSLALGGGACTPSRAPHPCRVVASAVPPKPDWPAPGDWAVFSLPQPGNGWISSVAVSPDGTMGVYGGSIGGSFIPLSDEVTLIRFEIGAEMDKDLKPAVFALPGKAMRNFAALAWSRPGLAWGSWSSLGTAIPATGAVRRLHELPVPEGKKERESFPFHSSVAWAPGGDCIAATVELPGEEAELVTWNTAGARAPAARHPTRPLEKIAAWTDQGVLLVRATDGSSATARWLDPETGHSVEGPPPPPDAQAYSWLGGGWLTIDRLGTVMHRVPGEPATPVASVPARLEIAATEKRKWLRVLPSENGRALIVEESVVAPKKDQRHMHVLTPVAR